MRQAPRVRGCLDARDRRARGRRLHAPRARPVSQHRAPIRARHDHAPGRGSGGGGDGHHGQDRGGRQHHRRHRRAPLDVERGIFAGRHRVQAGQAGGRRGAGRSRQGQQRSPRSTRGRGRADREQGRPAGVPGPARRAPFEASDTRRDGGGRQARSPPDREYFGRRAGDPRRRARAASSRAHGSDEAPRLLRT
jgi:hypothetical protein